MRCTQIMGLPSRAIDFLSENGNRSEISTCETCGHTDGGDLLSEVYADASEVGMFDDGPNLRKYCLKDNTYVYEIVQDTPWSSGPMIFLALSRSDQIDDIIEEAAWTEEEIQEAAS